MIWGYVLIGFILGAITGVLAMRLGNCKLRQQKILQHELKRSKSELNEYREELINHFARSAKLLDNMTNDYHQLYQHMIKSSSSLLPDQYRVNNLFRYNQNATEKDSDQILTEIQPRDYSENTSDSHK